MKYTTYYEENDTINYKQYENAIQNLMWEEDGKIVQDVVMRKVIFENPTQRWRKGEEKGSVTYSICMKDFKWNELYVERKNIQNGLIFKSYVKVSKKECEKILVGDIAWMKTSKKSLLQDFYLEITINGLLPVTLKETTKDICENIRGDDCIVFNKSIKRAMDCYADFFKKDLPMIDCLNCDSVVMSYKRTVKIPTAVTSIINIRNSNTYTLAYSL